MLDSGWALSENMERINMKSRLLSLVLIGLFFGAPVRADILNAIAKVKPSVVIVGTFKTTSSPRFGLRGTGFVVSNGNRGQGNLVLTNAHVLQQPSEENLDAGLVVQIRVSQTELQMRPVVVLEVDKLHDLALLRFEGPPVPALNVRDSGMVQEGQNIAFMGFPIGGALGFSPVTHRGMVSSIAAAALPTPTAQQLNEKTILSLRGGGSFNIFQLDGTAYPGNSGGPLFDPETGDVLGIVNMVFIKGTRESALTNPSGITYAIPSVFILQLLQRSKLN
ncbi:serine protease [Polaromonas sp. OV174]|uniref:S1 family peptidase n=1 Tax=Polaromonas sp. OV174 TaxID=1855300 RepID=UPI002100E7EF|nr:serine protease [Polaromonas sp. OV174]